MDPLSNARKARYWDALKELHGYVENGSEQTVKITTDDATRTTFIGAGPKVYYREGRGLESAMNAVIESGDIEVPEPSLGPDIQAIRQQICSELQDRLLSGALDEIGRHNAAAVSRFLASELRGGGK